MSRKFFTHEPGIFTTEAVLLNTRPAIINMGGMEERLISALDLFSLRGTTREDVAKIFHTRAGIELDGNYGKENTETLDRMRVCWSKAVAFMQDILVVEIPRSLESLNFGSSDDIVGLFQKVDRLRVGKQAMFENIGFAPIICALLKVCGAYNFVMNSQHIEKLNEDRENLQRMLLDDNSITLIKNGDIDEELSADHWESLHFSMRGRKKSEARQVCKVLTKVELDEDEILKDGLGLRVFAGSTEDVLALITYFVKKLRRLQSKLHPESLNLENKGLLSHGEMDKIFQKLELSEWRVRANGLPEEQKMNPHQGETFKAINFTFVITLPNGTEGSRKRSAEIQFVLDGNQNEEGWNDHHMYQLKQRLSAITRLFGYITEGNMRRNLQKTAQAKGSDEDEILKRLFEEQNIVKIGPHTYSSGSQFDRLINTGMYPCTDQFLEAII